MNPLLVALLLMFALGFTPAVLLFAVNRADRNRLARMRIEVTVSAHTQQLQQIVEAAVALPGRPLPLSNVKTEGNARQFVATDDDAKPVHATT